MKFSFPMKKNLNYKLTTKDEYGNVVEEKNSLNRSLFIEENIGNRIVLKEIKTLEDGNIEIGLVTGVKSDVWLVADFSGKLISREFSMNKNEKSIIIQKPDGYSFGSFHFTLHYSTDGIVKTIERQVDLEKNPFPYNTDLHFPDRALPGERVELSLEVTDNDGNPAITALTVAGLSESLRKMFEGEEHGWESSVQSLFNRGFVTYDSRILTDELPSMFPSITNIIDYTEDYFIVAEAKVGHLLRVNQMLEETSLIPHSGILGCLQINMGRLILLSKCPITLTCGASERYHLYGRIWLSQG